MKARWFGPIQLLMTIFTTRRIQDVLEMPERFFKFTTGGHIECGWVPYSNAVTVSRSLLRLSAVGYRSRTSQDPIAVHQRYALRDAEQVAEPS